MYLKLLFIPIIFLGSTNIAIQQNKFKKSPKEIALLLTKDLLSRPDFMMYNTPDVHALHYAEVCAAYGALKFVGQINDSMLLDALLERYDTIKFPNTTNHVDANVYGILPLEMYLQTKKQSYFDQGIRYADQQWDDPSSDGLTSQTRFWIDDIYMIGSLQVQAYRATGKLIYLERAALEIDTYIEKLQQDNGLFYHGLNAPFFWGRGNGWAAAGLAELLSELPKSNPHYGSILKGYQKMMKTLLDNQSEDGMWHQLIDKPNSFKETSSTAMFGFAMTMGVKKKLLPKEPYDAAAIKAWNALVDYINEDGKVREVCVGTGKSEDVNHYLTRPRSVGDFHGQAPTLWFANTLMAK